MIATAKRLTDDGNPDLEHDIGECIALLLTFLEKTGRKEAIWTSPDGTVVAITSVPDHADAITKVIVE